MKIVSCRLSERQPRVSATFEKVHFGHQQIFRTMLFIGIGGVYFCTALEDRRVYFSEPTPVLGVA